MISALSLTIWHKRFGHLNFPTLRIYLDYLQILFYDDSKGHVCDSCQLTKATSLLIFRHNLFSGESPNTYFRTHTLSRFVLIQRQGYRLMLKVIQLEDRSDFEIVHPQVLIIKEKERCLLSVEVVSR